MKFIVGGGHPSRRLILALTPSALRAVRLGPRRNRAMVDAAVCVATASLGAKRWSILFSLPLQGVCVCVVGRFWGLEPREMEWSKKFEAIEYAESAW